MSEFVIEKVFVFLVETEGPLKAFARIQIEGGLFIAELRVYQDSRDPNLLYISFPTRQSGERKVVYPVTDRARVRITEAITKEYLKEIG